MKRRNLPLFITFLLILSGVTASAQTTWYVNDNSLAGDEWSTAMGNDANAGTSPAAPKATITAAMVSAVSGDRIMVDNGEYLVSSLVIKNGVKVVGASPDNTVLRIQAAGAPVQMASNSELWNCKLYRAIPSVAGGAPTITLSNQTGSSNIHIENCYFYKNRTAIYLDAGTNMVIVRNRFEDNRTGILVDVYGNTNQEGLIIRDNEIKDSRSFGIIFLGMADDPNQSGYVHAKIDNNIFTGNLAGGMENNNANASTSILLRNNWFGHTPVDINPMRTNGGFNVADHDGTGFTNPTFTDNGTLLGADYPNDRSGANTNGFVVLTDAASAPMGVGPTLFVTSTNPAFDYYTNVQDAINASSAGATITVPDGTFREDVTVNKQLTIAGTSQNGTIIKGLYYGDANAVSVNAANASITNLTVTRDYGMTDTEWNANTKNQGITLNANGDTVRNVTITGNRNGLYINNRQGSVVQNNNIVSNRTGIQMANNISNATITNNIINNNFTHGLMINTDLGPADASNVIIKNNQIKGNWYTNLYLHGANTITAPGANFGCNDYGTNAPTTNAAAAGEPGYASQVPSQLGGTPPANNFADMAGSQVNSQATAPWLVNATDADIAMSGFQRSNTLSVVPVTGTLSPANNDYRIVANAIGCAQSGDVVTLSGTFDWSTNEAKAAWALGTNGVSEGSTSAVYSGSGDDYAITPQENTNNVTITANTQGGATIKGPGDLANVTLESALFFNDNKATSSYKHWTISNLIFKDLDVSVIADINGSHSITAMDSFKFTNNQVYIPADLNATAAPADNYQNIGLHLAFGKGQQVTNNTFYIDGTGVSDSANGKYSNSNAIQSANSGNQVYDGLKIDNNQIHVTGAPDANPARIVGIWENSNDQHSNIEIKENTFVNDDAGNTYDKNNQLAFRITSFSDATHQVSYSYNEVNGWNRAFEFLGDPFATYQPNLYYSAASPVVFTNNLIQNVAYGIGVHKRGGSTNSGAPAVISNNSFTNIGGKAVFYDSTGNIDANCNWWGTTSLTGIDSLIQVSNGATISRGEVLTSGGNSAATGFDPSGTCEGVVQNLTAGTTHPTIQDAIDNATPGDTIYAPAGVYHEAVSVDKKITLEGAQHGIDPRPSAGSSRSIDGVNETIVIAPGGQRVINIAADSVTVDGFELKHTDLITYGEDVVSCDASPLKNGLVITNNIITNANDEGIQLRGASNVLIEKNYVYGSRGDGINLSSNPTGQNQKIYDNEIDSSNSPYGSIYLYGVNDVEIKGNYIHGFNNGMAIGEGSDPNNYVSNIHIHNNEIHSEFNHYIATLYGIAIANSNTNHVTVDSNTIITNTNDAIGPSHLAIIRVNDNPSDISINDNYLERPQDSAYIFVANTVTNEVNANCNWYGSSSYNDIAQRISGTGAINAIPYLIDSTDNSTDIGFTPTATACYAPVHNITQGRDFNTIQSAVASPFTVDGDTIMVEDGTYNDQVLVNKSVMIKSMPGADVIINDTAGAVTGKPTLFDVSVNNVTIDSLHFKVDLSRLRSAIIASGAAIDTITIKNNLIEPYGTPSGAYGDRNAVSVNYGGSTNYRNATGGVANIIFESNTVTANGGNSFRAGICADEAGGTFTNNTLQSMNQDVLVRFANNGPVTITDNHINGGGVEVSDHNAQAGLITISGNTFDGTATSILPVPNPLLRLKQNNHAIPTVVSSNTFNNVVWGISLENYNADTIYGNTFTPLSTATAFRHITVNTKLLNSTAIASIPRETIDADIHDNVFNGLAANNTGKALAFYNHWNDGGAQYGTFTVANNTFNTGIANYIYLDTLNGVSTNVAAVTALYPEYPDDNAQPTTTGYWTMDIPDSNNLYAVGGPSALAYSAMSFSQRYDSLYGHIYDKVDNANIGRVIFAMPVHNLTHPADYASIQDAVDAAVAGDTIVADAGVYMESVTVNKSLDIRGAQYGNPVMGRTFGNDAESEVKSPAGKSAFKITAGNNVSIRGFSLEGSSYGGGGKGVEEWSSLTGTRVSENFIHNYTGSIGVSLAAGSTGFDIAENDIRNNYAGVYLSENAHDGAIHNNIIADNVNGGNDQGAAISAEANNNSISINNNTITNNGKALWIWSGLGTTLNNFNFIHNEVNNNTASVVNNLNAITLNAVCNWYGDTAGPLATAGITTALNARTNNWLVYGDADPVTIGFQTQSTYTVASNGNDDAINNDYRILSNAIGCAQKGDVITLNGAFDWSNSEATAAWAKGNNGVDDGGTGDDNKDDWAILLPTDVDSVTLTGINNATINGPGDLAQANLEAFIASYAGHNRQWDISNLTVKDIDAGILFDNGATVSASDSLKIHDNTFYIPKDSTADANQNIGIDLANGFGQEVYNNTFIVDGTGQSNGAQKSQSVVLQSTTTGGTRYDGLKIHDNTVRVTGVPDATDPAYIIGFWDNGQNKNADIQLYNNKFMNDDAGNMAANNRQLAFRVTSRSGADKTVTYNHNEITGFNRAIDWIGDPFSSYGAPNYEADAMPVVVEHNKFDNVTYGVSVRKAAGQPNTGAPAEVHENSFTNIDSLAISYSGGGDGTVDASCNYYDTADYSMLIAGNISAFMHLDDGTNTAAIGFDPSNASACVSRVHNITQNTWYGTIQDAINNASTISIDTIVAASGIYRENIVVDRAVDLRGNNYGINPNAGTRVDESVIVPASNDTSAGSIIYLNTAASGSSVNGFTLDGDNELLSDGSDINGADANTSEAVSAYDGIGSVTIKDNIVRSLAYAGIDLYNYNNGGAATSGNTIEENKIANITSGLYGIGVIIYNNAYTEIGNNVFDSVRTGIQTGNFSKADPGNSHSIHDNVITNVSHRGIFHNLHYGQATSFDIANNTISGFAGGSNVDGIMVSSIQNNAGANIINNTIADVTNGYNLWNDPTNDTIKVTGGSINNAVRGIFANNYAGYSNNADASAYIIDGVSIQDAAQASVYVQDSGNTAGAAVMVSVRNNAQLNNTTKGIVLQGANAKLQFDGTLPATFTGQAWYIDQVTNGTNVPNTDIDASEVATDIPVDSSVAGQQDYNTVQLIEGRVNDKDDDASLGQVYFKMPVLNVNTNHKYPDIQSAVDAASPGDSLFADKWIYKEDVLINKDNIKLSGVLNATDTSEVIGLISTNPSILITANNVSVSNLMVTRDGNDPAHFLNHPKTQGIAFNSRTGTHLFNLYVHGNRTGIDMNNAPNTTIEFCDVDFNRTGIMVNNNCDGSVIRNNNITNNWTEGLLLNIMSAGVTNNLAVHHNKIAGNWYSNVENRHTGTLIDLTGNSWNTDSVWATSNPAGEASYNAVWPTEYGGSGTPVAAQGYFISGATDRVDYTAWLPSNVVNSQPAGAPGFLPDTGYVYVDEASPTLPGMTKLDRAAAVVAEQGTIHLTAPVINSVLTTGKELTITGNAGSHTINGLTFNGVSKQLHLAASLMINNSFDLQAGVIKIEPGGQLSVDMSTASMAVNESNDNYVDGPMSILNASGDILFPVGKNGMGNYAKLHHENGTGSFTAEYFPASYSNLMVSDNLLGVSNKEYWNIEQTAGNYEGKVELYSNDSVFSNINSNAVVAHFNGAQWESLGQSVNASNPLRITADSVSSVFSPFTFGSGNGAPIAIDDNYTTNEDVAVTLIPLANDNDPDNNGLTIVSVNNVALTGVSQTIPVTNGSVEITITGTDTSISFVPAADYNGTVTFPYEITDGFGLTASANEYINVVPVNDAPVAADNNYTTNEDVPVTLTPLDNDTDPENDPLTITDINGTALTGSDQTITVTNGTVTITGGVISYTPNSNYNGTETIPYEISDGNGDTVAANINITVIPVNDDPVAVDDNYTTNEDVAVTLTPLGNDSDADGDVLTVSDINGTALTGSDQTITVTNGTVTITGGVISYAPNSNYNGTETIPYQISDGNGGTATANINITINAVNDDPVAVDDNYTTNEDVAVTLIPLGNDTDPENDPLAITDINGTALTGSDQTITVTNGTVTITGGVISYAPNSNYNGTETIPYQISDGNGGTATANINITINAVNDDPVAVDDNYTTNEDVAVTLTPLGNDTDPENDPLAITDINGTALTGSDQTITVTNGTVTITGGVISYAPNSNYNGTETIPYGISDGNGGTATANINITINAVNDDPVAVDDNYTTNEDVAVTLTPLDNDTDPENDPLAITDINGTALTGSDQTITVTNGTVTITGGVISYAPNSNYNGTETIPYQISDGNGGTATANINITINAVNDAPVAMDDNYTTNEDVAVTLTPLGNDSDADGDMLSVSDINGTALTGSDQTITVTNGTVTITGGVISYAPNSNYNGTETIPYGISDGNGGTATANINITINAVNDAPVATDDNYTTDEDQAVTLTPLDNDTDPENDPLAITDINGTALTGSDQTIIVTNGTVTITGGVISYAPNSNYNGTETIPYGISDGNGGTATANINITINAVNDAPVALDDSYNVNEDESVTLTPSPLANDSDADGDSLAITSINGIALTGATQTIATADGQVQVTVSGTDTSIAFTPAAGFSGNTTFSYGVSDGNGGTATANIDIIVAPMRAVLAAKVYLQGAYNASLGRHKDVTPTWATILKAYAMLQPYNTPAFGNYNGTESALPNLFKSTASDTDIVDWVLLELKDAGNNIVARRAALVLENGNIVDTDGYSPVTFHVVPGNYYVNIKHRNHLPVRSSVMLSLNGTATSYDFTATQSAAYQNPAVTSNAAMAEVNGKFAMWGGNGANGISAAMNSVRVSGAPGVNDYTYLLNTTGASTFMNAVYSNADYNLDGNVRLNGSPSVNDYSLLLNMLGVNSIINAHQ